MVKAILEDRKLQTRRMLKVQPQNSHYPFVDKIVRDWNHNFYGYSNDSDIDIFSAGKCPFGIVDDILWIRETWLESPSKNTILYKADFPMMFHGTEWDPNEKVFLKESDYKWKPSIHMPKDIARIFLKVTNVRVERLQDISEEDAIAEGVLKDVKIPVADFKTEIIYRDYTGNTAGCLDARSSFMTLWKSVYGKESWNSNPWIWVIEFEKVERPKNF